MLPLIGQTASRPGHPAPAFCIAIAAMDLDIADVHDLAEALADRYRRRGFGRNQAAHITKILLDIQYERADRAANNACHDLFEEFLSNRRKPR
jgi:hypothetical protein